MQISRHWRLNANRYRLQGVRYPNGAVSVQNRPMADAPEAVRTEKDKQALTAA